MAGWTGICSSSFRRAWLAVGFPGTFNNYYYTRKVKEARMFACEAFWIVKWDDLAPVPSGVDSLSFAGWRNIEDGSQGWGASTGPAAWALWVSEANPHSLSFSLDSLGSVFNCWTDYFRKWVSGWNGNEVQPQREFPAGTMPKRGGLRVLEEVEINILLQSMWPPMTTPIWVLPASFASSLHSVLPSVIWSTFAWFSFVGLFV